MKQYREAITTMGRTFQVDGDATLRVTEHSGDSSYVTLITNSFDVVKGHVKNLLRPSEEVMWFEVAELHYEPKTVAQEQPASLAVAAGSQGSLF